MAILKPAIWSGDSLPQVLFLRLARLQSGAPY